VHGIKGRAHPNLGEKAIVWALGANACNQIRVKRMGADCKFQA
jgi:hypothetical protein